MRVDEKNLSPAIKQIKATMLLRNLSNDDVAKMIPCSTEIINHLMSGVTSDPEFEGKIRKALDM